MKKSIQSLVALIVVSAAVMTPEAAAYDVDRLGDEQSFQGNFGSSVATDGNRIIVGQPGRGAVHIYAWNGSDWVKEAGMVRGLNHGRNSWKCGSSVDISGNYAIYGCPYAPVRTKVKAGQAWIMYYNGDRWTYSHEEVGLAANPATEYDSFGFSVALSGTTAVVGAPYSEQTSAYSEGGVFVFARSGSQWNQTNVLHPGVARDNVGWDVDIDGFWIIAGAPRTNTSAGSFAGVAHLYVHWFGNVSYLEEIEAQTAPDGSGEFGRSVAVSGNYAIVGAPFADTGARSGNGRAYVYKFGSWPSGYGWEEVEPMISSDPSGSYFGRSVAIDTDGSEVWALVGETYTHHPAGSVGSVFAFEMITDTWWRRTGPIYEASPQHFALFGCSTAIHVSGQDVFGVSGALNYDFTQHLNAGTVMTIEGL
jgi:hypothetical protein